jgi:hypothetical protein
VNAAKRDGCSFSPSSSICTARSQTSGENLFVVLLTDPTSQELGSPAIPGRFSQAENLIKLHKTQLASDRTSCRSANANQMRLILHTAAYWLLWRVQQAIPKTAALARAEFTTLRLRLLKVAARVMESATRIRIAFASACPDADLLRAIVLALKPAPA